MTFMDTLFASHAFRSALACGALALAVGCGDAPKPGTDTNWPSNQNDSGTPSPGNPYDPYASNGSSSNGPTTSNNPYNPEQTGTGSDAGLTSNYPSAASDGGTPTGSSFPSLFGDGGLFTGSGSSSGSQSGGDGGMPMECQNQICFDVFDCYILHPDKINCGWTSCDFGTCK
jgi:hypothetical protein